MKIPKEVNKTGYLDPYEINEHVKKFYVFGRDQKGFFLRGKDSYDRRIRLYNHCLIGRAAFKFQKIYREKGNIQA